MLKVAIEIPIKARPSERVPNKNWRALCGKPLAFWLLDELAEGCPAEWDLWVDSERVDEDRRITDRYGDRFKFHQRDPWFASNAANGNHLIHQFAVSHPGYEIYGQAFVTAVGLRSSTICRALERIKPGGRDSVLLATNETGWWWFNGRAVNYDPDVPAGLPRSQDAQVLKETTGFYAIRRDVLFETGCRVGRDPAFEIITTDEALDIDTADDLASAAHLLLQRGGAMAQGTTGPDPLHCEH